jgi:hypothetical protein
MENFMPIMDMFGGAGTGGNIQVEVSKSILVAFNN